MYGNMAERIDQEREEIYSLAMKKRFNQIQFNRIVMDFMIHGMHPPSLLKDQSFVTLLNGKFECISPELDKFEFTKLCFQRHRHTSNR